jgi:hypothetical protein
VTFIAQLGGGEGISLASSEGTLGAVLVESGPEDATLPSEGLLLRSHQTISISLTSAMELYNLLYTPL